ncbi:hypothetical protein [Nocardioides sp.]|uniref:hypothetical protein n=1 Tax=Nocardioides sp. TaxID=35761 RepID=UPI003515400B
MPAPIRPVLTLLALLAPLLTAPAAAAPADAVAPAAVGARALVSPDAYRVFDASRRSLKVLANDDGAGQVLHVCEVLLSGAAAGKVAAGTRGTDPRRILIETRDGASGTVTFRYRACPPQSTVGELSTVTLRITALRDLVVRRAPRDPRRLLVTNPNERVATFRWGTGSTDRPRGGARVAGRRTVSVRVPAGAVYWAAVVRDGDGAADVGHGEVRPAR